MHALKMITASRNLVRMVVDVFLTAVAVAVIGAVGGGVFGVLCGLLDSVARLHFDRIVPWGLFGLAAGAVAGALVGGFGRLFAGEDVSFVGQLHGGSPEMDGQLIKRVAKEHLHERRY
jgi:hypothetical protein